MKAKTVFSLKEMMKKKQKWLETRVFCMLDKIDKDPESNLQGMYKYVQVKKQKRDG